MSEKIIEFKSVNKWYGKFHVLKDINLFVNKGEKIIICGPSGSGKSTCPASPGLAFPSPPFCNVSESRLLCLEMLFLLFMSASMQL